MLSKTECELHAYVLMTNHIHLLVTPRRANGVTQFMHGLSGRYVKHINTKYGRTGTLWEGRYKATVVDSDEYLLAVHRYIELNPVQAGMTATANEYEWSSHRANRSGRPMFPLSAHSTYLTLGAEAETRGKIYASLFEGEGEAPYEDVIRSSTQRGLPIGSDEFRTRVEKALGRRISRTSWGGARQRLGPPKAAPG